MSALAEVFEEWRGEVPMARLSGEIDASNVGDVTERLRRLLTNRSTTLVIDLSPTTYLDSAGINMLFTLGDELRARQQTLRLVVADGSPVSRMLALTGLDRAQPTYPVLADALAAN